MHVGHLLAAETAREELQLTEVMFIPAGAPWMKEGQLHAVAEDRVAMVKLAVGLRKVFTMSRLEVDRSGPSYTVDTLEILKQSRSAEELYLILGMDAFLEMPRWREPERVVELAQIVVARRPGYGAAEGAGVDAMLSRFPGLQSRLHLLHGPAIDISATDIRLRVMEGRSIRYLVPEAVQTYIHWRGLYTAAKA